MSSKEAKRFANNYVNEMHRWKEYQRNRVENSKSYSKSETSKILTNINRMLLTGDKNQKSLTEFCN